MAVEVVEVKDLVGIMVKQMEMHLVVEVLTMEVVLVLVVLMEMMEELALPVLVVVEVVQVLLLLKVPQTDMEVQGPKVI